MKSVIENLSPVKKKILIEVPQDDMANEMNKALADYGKKVKIPGFRPGKAPRSLVERHYGDQLQGEVMNKLITRSYFSAVREHNIDPVVMPEFSDISFTKGETLSFTATVEVRTKMATMTAENLLAGLRGETLPYPVNPQVVPKK